MLETTGSPTNRGLKAEAQTLREIDEPNVGGTLVPAGTLLLVCQYKSAKHEGKSRADVCRTNKPPTLQRTSLQAPGIQAINRA